METTVTGSFRTFEDLEAYQVAREFRRAMYAVTRKLPEFEKFELASQIRRAAVSLTNNIAEGHGRYHYPDQLRFLLQARGSLEELMDDLNICEDEKYLPNSETAELKEFGWRVHNLINATVATCVTARKARLTYSTTQTRITNLATTIPSLTQWRERLRTVLTF